MSKRAIVHVEIPAKDRVAAVDFYSKLFAWSNAYHDDTNHYSGAHASNMGVGFSANPDNPNPAVVIYLHSDDIDADVKAVEAHGGKSMMPKMQIPNSGAWMTWVTDPSGNALGLLQPGSEDDMTPGAGHPFVHVEITATDPKKLATFYQDVFGWDYKYYEAPYDYYSASVANVNMGAGFPAQDGTMYKGAETIVYIGSEDLAADRDAIKNAGGTLIGDVINVPNMGNMQFFLDKEGNRLALWQNV